MQPGSSTAGRARERDQTDSDAADPTGANCSSNGFRLLHFDTCGDLLAALRSDSPYDVKRAVLTLYYTLLENLAHSDANEMRALTDSLHLSDNTCRLSSHAEDNHSHTAFTAAENDSADFLSTEESDPFLRSWKASSLRAHPMGVLSPLNGISVQSGGRHPPHVDSINSSPLAGVLPPSAEGGGGPVLQNKVPLCAACIRQLLFIVATSTSNAGAAHLSGDGVRTMPNITADAGVDGPCLGSNSSGSPHAKHRQAAGNPWLEVNKTIAFIFQLIVSRGFGKALADVLLHTGVRQGTAEEARLLNSIFHCECFDGETASVPRARASAPSVGSDSLDRAKDQKGEQGEAIEPSPLFAPPRGTIPPARIASLRLVLTLLIDAHGDAAHVLPAAEVFQALTHIRPVVKFMYAYMLMREDGDANVSPTGDAKSSEFYRTFVGQLCIFLTAPLLVSVGQAWKSLLCLLKAHRPYASVFLLYHMHSVVTEVLMTAIDDKSCVLKYYGLSLLNVILQEGAFGAASVLYATSPALLCSVLLCSNGLTSQTISQKIFEVLTKMICAPGLPLPTRYILFTNRDSILRMVDYMSSLAYAQRAWDTQTFEQDKRRLLGRLSGLPPLSEDEVRAVLLGE